MFKLKHNFLIAIFLFILCLTAYHNVYHNDFFLDDQFLIVNGGETFSKLSFKDYFKAYPGGLHVRPVGTFLIAKLFLLFETNVVYYHVFNLTIFYSLCLCVFLFLRHLTRNYRLAAVVSILFCVHPINAVFINFITTHIFTILAILGLLSILFLSKSFDSKSQKWTWHALSVICFGLSFLCHPIALSILLTLCVWTFIYKRIPFKQSIAIVSPYLLIAVGYIVVRLVNGGQSIYAQSMSVQSLAFSFAEYWSAILDLSFWYVSKLFYPVDIIFINNIMHPSTNFLWGKILLLVLCLVLFFVFYRNERMKIFSILWFLSGFVVAIWATQIYYYLGVNIEILWFIFSSIGLFLLIGLFLEQLYEKSAKSYYIIVSLLVGLCVFQTTQLNTQWQTEDKYFTYLTKIAPDNVLAWKNMGDAFLRDGKRKEALNAYEQAVSITWAYKSPEIFGRIGRIYEWDDNLFEAAQNYYNAIISDPVCVSCAAGYQLNYESAIYKMVREEDATILELKFLKDHQANPDNYFYIWNLASLYLFNAEYDKAVQTLEPIITSVDEPIIRKIFLSKLASVYYHKGLLENSKLYIQMMFEDKYNRRNMDILNVAFMQRGLNPKTKELQDHFREAGMSVGK